MLRKSFNAAITYGLLATLLICGLNSCNKQRVSNNTPSLTKQGQLVADLNSIQSVNPRSLSELKEKEDREDREDHDNGPVPFNLNVILTGQEDQLGYIRFRQSPGTHIITLDTWVFNLEPNHTYLLQRAVNPLVYNCTSTAWLTLGKGLTPQAILTDSEGFGMAQLFRNVPAVASGSTFDIHFRIIDATSNSVVLESECYQYMVR